MGFRKGATRAGLDFMGSFYEVHLEQKTWGDTATLCAPPRAGANHSILVIVQVSRVTQSQFTVLRSLRIWP